MSIAVAKPPSSSSTFAVSDTLIWRLLSICVLFGSWEIAGRIPISVAFPSFLETMTALGQMTIDGRILAAYAETLKPLVVGVGISATFGIIFGIAMGLSRGFQWIGEPIFVVMQAAPMVALIPLVTFAYGIGLAAKVCTVIILATPIIVLNSYKAVRNANTSLIQMCQSFQGTRLQQITKVIIPDASPMIFAGLRLGIAAGFIGVILAELLITPTGIGDLITYHRSVAEYADMYAAIFSIILFAAVSVGLLERAEVAFFRPERKKRKDP